MSYRYNRYNDPDYYWKADEKKIKRDFMNYANKQRRIEQEGYEKMGKTLGIDIYEDTFITYFIFKCGVTRLDYITEDEYMVGMKALKCNALTELKNKMSTIRGNLLVMDKNEEFRKFYNFLFNINVSVNMNSEGWEKEVKKKIFKL